MNEKKVTILGATQTWQDAPLHDPSWEVWGLNQFWYRWSEFATRWFEIHPLAVLREQISADDIHDLETSKIPIYMDQRYASIPMSIPYPIKDVSRGHLRLFTSTFCYQLALAIYEGFTDIGLYGVDFSRGSARERLIEWRALLYWLGVAEGCGIRIVGSSLGTLEHPYLYGLEYWDEVEESRRQVREFRSAPVDGVRWWMRWRARWGSQR